MDPLSGAFFAWIMRETQRSAFQSREKTSFSAGFIFSFAVSA